MAFIEDLADALAKDALAACDEMEDDRFYEKVARTVGALSPTLQEAFMTSIRIRLAERRGRTFIAQSLAAKRGGGAAPQAPRDTDAGH